MKGYKRVLFLPVPRCTLRADRQRLVTRLGARAMRQRRRKSWLKHEQVAKALTAQGPGQCFAIPADLQKLEEVKRLVDELSKREQRM